MVTKSVERTIRLSDGFIHIHLWQDGLPPRRVVVLIHGLMMHGKVFEMLAQHLVLNGALVIAPDLRGFGRWHFKEGERRAIDFVGSLVDIGNLLDWVRLAYPDVPVILAGESLGAHIARSLASTHWHLFDGLILSSPCIRPRMMTLRLIPHAVSTAMSVGFKGQKEVSLTRFANQFLVDEPENLKDYLSDPMSRKSLDVLELIESMLIVGRLQVPSIPSQMPILVYRGSNDGVCQSASYKQFMSSLKSDDMTVFNCGSCAHMILQSKSIDIRVLARMADWLAAHERTGPTVKRCRSDQAGVQT
ncbi:MAG: alpha/beta fold hydrolase [Candidatus Obscuribacterales bacterium]|nr:alpha/beta fold hydrolase [Cyanobacteria bacterium SZAS LIN-5]